jgi:DNA-binding response OmpR family regulator
MRILVIEDEAKTAKFLKQDLGEAGFGVDSLRRFPRLSCTQYENRRP